MKIALAGSVGMMAVSGLGFVAQPVSVPLGAVVGLAVLPTAELSAAGAAALNSIKRRFKNK